MLINYVQNKFQFNTIDYKTKCKAILNIRMLGIKPNKKTEYRVHSTLLWPPCVGQTHVFVVWNSYQ